MSRIQKLDQKQNYIQKKLETKDVITTKKHRQEEIIEIRDFKSIKNL